MAEEFKTYKNVYKKLNKETGKKEKQVVEKTYRIDADFVPAKVDEICIEFIQNYCVANGKIDWLIATMEKTRTHTHKTGEHKGDTIMDGDKPKMFPYSFPDVRSDFVNEFFSSILIGDKANSGKMTDILNALKAMK